MNEFIVIVLTIIVVIVGRSAWQINEIYKDLTRELPMARQSFEQLKDAVEKAASVKEAAIVVIHDIRDKLHEMAQHQPTPAEIQQLIAQINQHADALAEAIADHDE